MQKSRGEAAEYKWPKTKAKKMWRWLCSDQNKCIGEVLWSVLHRDCANASGLSNHEMSTAYRNAEKTCRHYFSPEINSQNTSNQDSLNGTLQPQEDEMGVKTVSPSSTGLGLECGQGFEKSGFRFQAGTGANDCLIAFD
jgi:hypothetical protein